MLTEPKPINFAGFMKGQQAVPQYDIKQERGRYDSVPAGYSAPLQNPAPYPVPQYGRQVIDSYNSRSSGD